MQLTFKNGQFILVKDGRESSIELKAANAYRKVADERAVRILDRAFVKTYPFSGSLPPFLDLHQVEGISWVLTRSRSYLAHAAGAGKTCEAVVAACLTPGEGQVVFIVPPSLTANWERETLRWASLMDDGTLATRGWPSVLVVPESARQGEISWRADFIICPDSMLAKPWVLDKLAALKFRFIAVDEASRFKEPSAQRTIALFGGKLKGKRTSPGLIQEARHAVLLDGSPMPNRPMELWAPTYAMSPESIDFNDQSQFGFNFCGAKINDYGRWEFKHASREGELKARLQKSFMHVVTEERLGHSERKRSMLFMNEDVRSATQKTWEKKHLHTINFDDIDEDMSQGEMATFRRELGMRKVPWCADYTRMRLEDKNESILLFAWHRAVVFELARQLHIYKPGVIMGGTRETEREEAFAQFQAGKKKLLILNIAAGGRGHNLQRADRAIFAEWSWNDETNKQCEKRASRKGRDSELPVRCDYLVCPNSMDEPILSGVFRKAASVRRIIG